MIYAVYRILYGEDFIVESLNSILNQVDKIFIFWTDKFFGDVSEVSHNGELIQFPHKIDNVIQTIEGLNNKKIQLIYDHRPNNKNHFTERINKYILPHYPKPNYILFMEPDFIYDSYNLNNSLLEIERLINKNPTLFCFSTQQIEYWKSLKYKVIRLSEYSLDGSVNIQRLGAMWWSLNNLDAIPPTGFHANPLDYNSIYFLDSTIHNLGYCINDRTMYWKFLGSIAYSELIGDDAPNKKWYDNKWIGWDFIENNNDLEPSKGKENTIPFAINNPLEDLLDLPEDLLVKMDIFI